MVQRNKQERKDLMTRAGASGSSSRTGPDDPRHRRGAQAEMEVEQRFDPDDFEVDDEQRVTVKKSVVAAQVVCLAGDANAISGVDTYNKVGLNAPTTSVGSQISVDTGNDHIVMSGAGAYLVEAEYQFTNGHSSAGKTGSLRIADDGGNDLGTRTVSIAPVESGKNHRAGAWVTAVVNVVGSVGARVQIMVAGNDAAVSANTGWVKAQRIG